MAQQNPLGMFDVIGSTLPGPASEDTMRQRAAEMARLSPEQRNTFTQDLISQRLGGAIGQGAQLGMNLATGQDARSPEVQARDLKLKLRAAMQGANLSDPAQAYPRMIQALQEAGMIGQAMAMTKEYEEITNKRRDDARNAAKDEAAAKNAAARTEIYGRGTQLSQNIEALGNLYKARDLAPAGSTARASIEHRIQIMEDAMSKRNIQIQDAGDKLEVYIDGQFVSSRPKGVDPDSVAKAAEKAKTGGEKISGEIADKLGTATARLGEYQRLTAGFRPEFATQSAASTISAATGFQDLYQKLTALAAKDPKSAAAAKWWQELAGQIMRVRHDIFGATLTQGEAYAFDAVRPLIGLPANVVAQRLTSMRDEAHRELKARLRGQAARGADVSKFEADVDALGVSGPAQGGPTGGRQIGPAPAAPVAAPSAPAASGTVIKW